MDSKDFDFIEDKLNCKLPEVFKRFMRRFSNRPGEDLYNEMDLLPANAELFVMRQLARFSSDFLDRYELQPELRTRRFLDIGGDGCGNFYCMPGDDGASDELWFWEHDPYEGLTQCEGRTLSEYFDETWRLTTRENPFDVAWEIGTVISRADHPGRSLLAPITLHEWLDYVGTDSRLELDENLEVPNPFTRELRHVRRYPGRVRFDNEGWVARIRYGGIL